MKERAPTRETGLASGMAAHEDRLSHCVHCGFCLPACPTYRRLGDEADSPRGRLHLMRAVAEGRLDAGADAFQRHLDRCLGCRACEPVCPSGVEYGFLLERARAVAGEARRPSRTVRILLALVERPALLAAWMIPSRLLRWTRIPSLLARTLPSGRAPGGFRLGMAMLAASLPAGAVGGVGGPGEGGGAPAPAPAPGSGKGEVPRRGRVALLRGCVQDHLFRRVNRATVRVLEANGWEVVEVPGQGCCGALHAHGGRLDRAREMARRNVGAFRAAGVDRIAANAAGCGAALREYAHLLEEEGGAWFSERVRDVTELLVEGGGMREGGRLPLRVAYDPPCHLLHGQGVRSAPLEVLDGIPGLEAVPVPGGEECCGGAGIYGITHRELGGRIGRDKAEAVRSTGAAVVATGNPGCHMQIGAFLRIGGVPMRAVHPVELVDESYRRGGLYRSPPEGSTRD